MDLAVGDLGGLVLVGMQKKRPGSVMRQKRKGRDEIGEDEDGGEMKK